MLHLQFSLNPDTSRKLSGIRPTFHAINNADQHALQYVND